jgi:GTP-sensing pleiotropic transcriptional regulator CodY
MNTIFDSIVDFLITEKAGIASKVLASATYDVLKTNLPFNSLKQKIGNMFKKERDADTFIKELCEKPATDSYQKDVANVYLETTGIVAPDNLVALLEEWIKENRQSIENINNIQISNSSGFNIGVQNAKKDIINIQGDYYSKNETNEN